MDDIQLKMSNISKKVISSTIEDSGFELDYTEKSIEFLEIKLNESYKYFSNYIRDQKTYNRISQVSLNWGAFLGEFICNKFNGTWVEKDGMILVIINNNEFFPIQFVQKKILSKPEFRVKKFLAEIEELSNSIPDKGSNYDDNIDQAVFDQKNILQNSTSSENEPEINNKKYFSENSNSVSTVTINRNLLYSGVIGVLILLLLCFLGVLISDSLKGSKEFRSNLNSFLLAAEELNILTNQGVSNNDFRNQYAKVKSTYSLIDNSWPSSFESEKNLFNEAIEGWSLTIEVWDYGLDFSTYLNNYYLRESSDLFKRCVTYTGIENESAKLLSIKEWIGLLMSFASDKYEKGSISVKNKL